MYIWHADLAVYVSTEHRLVEPQMLLSSLYATLPPVELDKAKYVSPVQPHAFAVRVAPGHT